MGSAAKLAIRRCQDSRDVREAGVTAGSPAPKERLPGPLRPNEGRNPLSDTTDVTSEVPSTSDGAATRRRRTGSGLSGMLLNELQTMASSLGISGTAKMRKGDLVTAIEESQAES